MIGRDGGRAPSRRLLIVLSLFTAIAFAMPSGAFARSKSPSLSNGPVTQTHTLFYNTTTCVSDGLTWSAYGFLS